MSKTYAVFRGYEILRMSADLLELTEYIKSFPPEERRRMTILEQGENLYKILSPESDKKEGKSHDKQSK